MHDLLNLSNIAFVQNANIDERKVDHDLVPVFLFKGISNLCSIN